MIEIISSCFDQICSIEHNIEKVIRYNEFRTGMLILVILLSLIGLFQIVKYDSK